MNWWSTREFWGSDKTAWYYNEGYMSLHICTNPQNVQQQEQTLSVQVWSMDFGWLEGISVGSSVITNVPLIGFKSPISLFVYVCFPTSISIALDTSWVPYNSTQFWHYLPGDSVRSHRLRVQAYTTIPFPHSGCQSQLQVAACASDQLAIDWRFQWPPP